MVRNGPTLLGSYTIPYETLMSEINEHKINGMISSANKIKELILLKSTYCPIQAIDYIEFSSKSH